MADTYSVDEMYGRQRDQRKKPEQPKPTPEPKPEPEQATTPGTDQSSGAVSVQEMYGQQATAAPEKPERPETSATPEATDGDASISVAEMYGGKQQKGDAYTVPAGRSPIPQPGEDFSDGPIPPKRVDQQEQEQGEGEAELQQRQKEALQRLAQQKPALYQQATQEDSGVNLAEALAQNEAMTQVPNFEQKTPDQQQEILDTYRRAFGTATTDQQQAQAQKDITESNFEDMGPVEGRLVSGGASFLQGVGSTVGRGISGVEAAASMLGYEPSVGRDLYERTQQATQGAVNPEYGATNVVAQGLGSTVPFIATQGVGTAAGLAGRGATALTAGAGASVGAGEGYETSREVDAAPLETVMRSVGGGALGTLEAAPVGRIMGRLNRSTNGLFGKALGRKIKQYAGRPVTDAINSAAEESLQELAQTAGEAVMDEQILGIERDIIEEVKQGTGAGGAVGGILGGLFGTMRNQRLRDRASNINQIRESREQTEQRAEQVQSQAQEQQNVTQSGQQDVRLQQTGQTEGEAVRPQNREEGPEQRDRDEAEQQQQASEAVLSDQAPAPQAGAPDTEARPGAMGRYEVVTEEGQPRILDTTENKVLDLKPESTDQAQQVADTMNQRPVAEPQQEGEVDDRDPTTRLPQGATGERGVPDAEAARPTPEPPRLDQLAQVGSQMASVSGENVRLEPAEPTTEKQRRVQQRARDLGVNLHYVRNAEAESGRVPFPAATSPSPESRDVYVDVSEPDRAAEALFHHEWVHDLRQQDEQAYTDLLDFAKESAPDVFNRARQSYQEGAEHNIQPDEEGTASLAEDLTLMSFLGEGGMSDAELQRMARQKPGLARRVLDTIERVAQKLGIGRGRQQQREQARLGTYAGRATGEQQQIDAELANTALRMRDQLSRSLEQTQQQEAQPDAEQVTQAAPDDAGRVQEPTVPQEGGDQEIGGMQVPPGGQEAVQQQEVAEEARTEEGTPVERELPTAPFNKSAVGRKLTAAFGTPEGRGTTQRDNKAEYFREASMSEDATDQQRLMADIYMLDYTGELGEGRQRSVRVGDLEVGEQINMGSSVVEVADKTDQGVMLERVGTSDVTFRKARSSKEPGTVGRLSRVENAGDRHTYTVSPDTQIPADPATLRRGQRMPSPEDFDIPFARRRKQEGQQAIGGMMEGTDTGQAGRLFDTDREGPVRGESAESAEMPADAEKFGITQQDVNAAQPYAEGQPTAAFTAGVRDYMSGRSGVRRVEGMKRPEAVEARRGFRAAQQGASPATREDVQQRVERAQGPEQDQETGTLFARRRSTGAAPQSLDAIKEKYPNVDLSLTEGRNGVNLNKIEVPRDQRQQGLGSQIMEDIARYADQTGQRVLLSPDTSFGGTSTNRLKRFYKRFGFVENKGQNKDFTTQEAMYREPDAEGDETRFARRRPRAYADIGHDPEGDVELWWGDRGGVEAQKPGKMSAAEAFGGPEGETVDQTHEDVQDAQDSLLRGRIDHDKKQISVMRGLDEDASPLDMRRALDRAYVELTRRHPDYEIHEFDMPEQVSPAPTFARRRGEDEGGEVNGRQAMVLGFVKDRAARGIKSAGALVRRNLTAAGDLPKQAFAQKVARDGFVNSQMREIDYSLRDFNSAARQAYGGVSEMSAYDAYLVDQVFKGERDIKKLPEPMRPVVEKLRAEVDAFSRHMIDEGVVEGDLAVTVAENMGTYATRSYRAFDDPKWAEKVPADVRNKAKALLRHEHKGMIVEEFAEQQGISTDEAAQQIDQPDTEANTYFENRIEGIIESLLYEGKAAESPIAVLSKSNLGSKDLSILKKRKGIAPEIRALWGEYKDARVNYARSITKMAHLIGNHRFLRDVRQAGMGEFFHEAPIVKGEQSFKTRIAADESKTMHPLNGLYTTPEIKTAFEEALERQQNPRWLELYMKANGAVKYAKTVGSLMTHVRNLIGNTGFAVANGHWRVGEASGAFKTVLSDLGAMNKQKWRDYYRKAVELGVVHESARAGELRDVIKDAGAADLDRFTGNFATRGAKAVLRGTTKTYQAQDDVWKVYAWENEKARYRKAMPEASEAEIERLTAEIVRNTYPTYSMVPRGIKWVRRFPATGAFVSFPAEVVRTAGNTLNQIQKELRSDNSGVKKIGAQRLAGALAAASAPAAIATASRMLMGISDEDDEDFRHFVAPWSRNSTIVYLGRSGDGNLLWVDMSYTNPYEYLQKPLTALMRGDDWTEQVIEAGQEAGSPFFGEEILAGKIVDLLRNRTQTGGRVFNPESNWDSVAMDMAQHIGEAFEPGTISSARRITKGITGTVTAYGRSYDPTIESLAVFTGHRLQTMDVPQSLGFRARDYASSRSDTTRILTEVTGRRGEVSEAEIKDAYRQANQNKRERFEDMRRMTRAANRLGVEKPRIYRALRASNIPRDVANDLLRGQYRPYEPSMRSMENTMEDALTEAKTEKKRREARAEFRKRQRALSEAYRSELDAWRSEQARRE